MSSNHISHRSAAFAIAAAVTACSITSSAHAANLTWTGGSGSNVFLGTAGNWSPAQSPTSADDLLLPATATGINPNFEAADAALSLTINNTGGHVWQLNHSGSANPRSLNLGAGGLTLLGSGNTLWGSRITTINGNQTWSIASGGTLAFSSGSTLSGSGKITKTGDGTITLFSDSTGFTGGWDIQAGTVTNLGGGTTNRYGTGAVTVSNTGTIDLNILGGGAVSGGAITLQDGGTLSGRTGIPTTGQTGLSSVSAGLSVDATNNATVIIKATVAGETLRLSSAITGGVGGANSVVRIQGPGEVHLMAGTNSAAGYSGTWKVESGGTLRPETNQALGFRSGANSGAVELAGGTIRWAGLNSGSTPVTFTAPITVTANSTMTVDKVFNSSAGSNTLPNNSGSIARVLGPLTIGAHTLTINGSDIITGGTTPSANVRMGGGTTTLTGNATFNVVNNATNNYGVEYVSGAIAGGAFGYTKSGNGTMSVTAANTYSGSTNVTGGLLQVLNAGGLGTTSSISVSQGATLSLIAGGANNWTSTADVSGSGTISITGGTGNTLTLNGSEVSPGSSAGILTINGNLALGASSALNIEVVGGGEVAGTDYDQLALTAGRTLSGLPNVDLFVSFAGVTQADLTGDVLTIVSAPGTNFTSTAFNSVTFSSGASATVSYNDGSITLSNVVVPEPTTLALLSVGVMGIMRRRRS